MKNLDIKLLKEIAARSKLTEKNAKLIAYNISLGMATKFMEM